jgi:hypothetical protein
MRGGVEKTTVWRYVTIGEAFPPEAAIRAGVSEEEMASLSLPTLLRAAKKPEAQAFTLLRDVLRKRRSRAAERERRPARGARIRPAPDARPALADPRPEEPDRRPPADPSPTSAGNGTSRIAASGSRPRCRLGSSRPSWRPRPRRG